MPYYLSSSIFQKRGFSISLHLGYILKNNFILIPSTLEIFCLLLTKLSIFFSELFENSRISVFDLNALKLMESNALNGLEDMPQKLIVQLIFKRFSLL